MPLDIQIKRSVDAKHQGTVTVELRGSLDTVTAPELEQKLNPILGGDVRDLVFDLAGLNFISSAGLRVFSATRKRLQSRGGQAGFVNMQPQIQEVFEIVKALPGVAVFRTYEEMDAYLALRQRRHEDGE